MKINVVEVPVIKLDKTNQVLYLPYFEYIKDELQKEGALVANIYSTLRKLTRQIESRGSLYYDLNSKLDNEMRTYLKQKTVFPNDRTVLKVLTGFFDIAKLIPVDTIEMDKLKSKIKSRVKDIDPYNSILH